MDQTIPTAFGNVQTMLLSFGPELTWLYAYLTADDQKVQHAKVRIELKDRTEVLADEAYPFEFSLPLKAHEKEVSLIFETISADGESKQAQSVRLSLE